MTTIKFLISAVIVTAFISCHHQTETNPSDPHDPTPPKNLITYEKAFEQLDNYRVAHPEVQGDQYALRTWVSIDELEKYIDYVRSEGKKNNITVNGIEFIHTQYNSAKPNMPNASNMDYDLTLMYAPTYKDKTTNKNEAFDPMNSEVGKPKKLSEVFAMKMVSDSLDIQAKSDTLSNIDQTNKPSGSSGIANTLHTCPNICP